MANRRNHTKNLPRQCNNKSVGSTSRHIAYLCLIAIIAQLTGCATLHYPDPAKVKALAQKQPELNTVADGKAYMATAIADMESAKNQLKRLDGTLNAGIVGGIVTVALGTTLHWSDHTNARASIFTAATLGVESKLSIPTQISILDKGEKALICVQAEAKQVLNRVLPLDAALALLRTDIRLLNEHIDSKEKTKMVTPETLDPFIRQARGNIARTQSWINTQSVPVTSVVSDIEVAVDRVIQVTMEQLDSTLPDGSAFSKINTNYSSSFAPSGQGPKLTQVQGLSTDAEAKKSLSVVAEQTQEQKALINFAVRLAVLDEQLNKDLEETKITIGAMPPLQIEGAITSSCEVEKVVVPLSASMDTPYMQQKVANQKKTISISGGNAPYKASITASSSGLTPDQISTTVSANAIELTSTANLVSGRYEILVADQRGTQRVLSLFVESAPVLNAGALAGFNNIWAKDSKIEIDASNLFVDALGLPLTYSAKKQDGGELPSWIKFDPASRKFNVDTSGQPPGSKVILKITATNQAKMEASTDITANLQ